MADGAYEGYCIGGPRHGMLVAHWSPNLEVAMVGDGAVYPDPESGIKAGDRIRVSAMRYHWAIYCAERKGDRVTQGYWRFSDIPQVESDRLLETVSDGLREWLEAA